MKFSIIISTYSGDRFDDLMDLVKSISKQTYDNIETIIVIDEDRDLFYKVKDHLPGNKQSNFKVIFNPENKGLSYSRNIGMRQATGEIIAFIDDDAIPDPKWAETITNTFEADDDVGAVTGDVIPLWEDAQLSRFPKELHWMISCSYVMTPTRLEEVDRGFGTNMAFRRAVLNQVGTFDTNLGIKGKNWVGGEDSDMFLRVREFGKRVIFNPDAKVFHKVYAERISTKNILKRAFNGGVSVAVMKSVRRYDMKNSTENEYLKRLLFGFYPKAFKELVRKPSMVLIKQMMVVGAVILFEGMGYLYGRIKK